MAKVALLIGVSDYEPGLQPLPCAVHDVDAMQRVLQHQDIGNFDQVNVLKNPDSSTMQEEIEALFSARSKDDLVLLFFSGHGIKDDSGKLYFATPRTRKSQKGELVKSSAVPASFVHEIMGNSRSKRQVVILDCCFSGAFAEGMTAKDDDSVDVQTQLGGEGRAVLTSSTSTQYSFEQESSDLSVYTRFLVEGIETGAADQDSDGAVAVDELHEYAKRRVHEAAPAMKPEIYAVKEGFRIRLAVAPVGDIKLQYRREIERRLNRGEISNTGRRILDAFSKRLGLPPEEALQIETEVLTPFREYRQNLTLYEQAFLEALQTGYPLSPSSRTELRRYQDVLGLRDEDVDPIESRLVSNKDIPNSRSKLALIPVSVSSSESDEAIPVSGKVEPSATPSVPRRRNWRLWVGGSLAGVLVLGGAIYAVIQWQTAQVEQQASTNLDRARTAAASGNVEDCLRFANQVSIASKLYSNAQSLREQCEANGILAQAKAFADKEQWQEAFIQVQKISSNSPMYQKAQELINQWTKQILEMGQNAYQQGQLQEAITKVRLIPKDYPNFSTAQEAIQRWQAEWQANKDHIEQAQKAIKARQWKTAIDQASAISDHPFWKSQKDEILKTANFAKQQKTPQPPVSSLTPRSDSPLSFNSSNSLNRSSEDQSQANLEDIPAEKCVVVTASDVSSVVIRDVPDGRSIAEVKPDDRLAVTGKNQTTWLDSQQIDWMEINKPVQGWLPKGFTKPCS